MQVDDPQEFRALIAPYERELRAYCYRMAGSLHDADDLLQESLLRAWRGLAGFEGRASLRTWLYRVAQSACLDALEKQRPRMLAIDEGPPADPHDPVPPPRFDGWIGPCPSALYVDLAPSPEARYAQRESVALAFLAALQLLPARQRAMLIARDVLGWSAEECADTLGTTVAAVNSSLQRARETIDARANEWRPRLPSADHVRELLARYIAAWESADVGAFASLLREEASLAMPPLPLWLSGRAAIAQSVGAMVLTPEARGAFRFAVTEANGLPALAAYQRNEAGVFAPAAIHVLSFDGDAIDAITAFLDPSLFVHWELPVANP